MAIWLCAPASFVAWWRSTSGLLQWDGARWFWADWGDTPVRALRASLDVQYCMPLQLHAVDGKSAWLFLERSSNPARWLALRRALFAHHAAHGAAAQPHGDGVSP